ncbi:maleylpyruvate isomerase family mycothiol-dependent enzyme [Streptomyces sp. SL13]|uniref:Maleylpyruvate isomerase family mycothiol-dependent enzyme n=1 Tax=Streptantibioticus silvisoli TaxID=2705255 RepID=A0AA90H3T6_9ACTN|nr:maleylpyruvate isomerase family mycothiol-dependent enzyme [Streptantibioticus silvisoli]MDI5970219.1 maleylpyruvate isomerase family mycothiol-dependent enzyme [Streptantibioticus silvisoli]
MRQNLAFTECLALVDERSATLRAAVAGAADLDVRVPTCPDWSLRDLVAHVGEVHRFWAAAVAAGPSAEPPADELVGDVAPRGELLAWSAESTAVLLTALRTAGPERGCWSWWGKSDAPLTAGAVARHQVQEAAVHAYDAQEAAGRPQPLPVAVALDGVPEFLTVSYGTAGPWPHEPARVAFHTTEGPHWSLDLTADQAGTPTTTVHAPASDLLLTLHRRAPLDRLHIEGDRTLIERLLAWPSLD